LDKNARDAIRTHELSAGMDLKSIGVGRVFRPSQSIGTEIARRYPACGRDGHHYYPDALSNSIYNKKNSNPSWVQKIGLGEGGGERRK